MSRERASRPAVLTVTSRAVDRIRALLSLRDRPALGVRVSLKTRGCSGLAYALDYVEEACAGDEVTTVEDVTIYVDPQAVLFLVGSVMDYHDDPLTPGFQFNNPNAKGQCGCGESFHV